MAAVALTVLDQSGPAPAGEALAGTVVGGLVTITNSNNTDVTSWSISLLDVPPDSALVPGVLAAAVSPTPSASFTPDKPGSYRIMLDVFDVSMIRGRDIRNFGIPNVRGVIVPPYQKLPDPLPVLGSGEPGEKPDEQNYAGQARGWAGDRASGQLEFYFATYEDVPSTLVTSTPFTPTVTNEAPLYLVDLSVIGSNAVVDLPAGARVGQSFKVQAVGGVAYTVTVNMPGGHTLDGASSLVIFSGGGENFVFLGTTFWARMGATLNNLNHVPDYSAEPSEDVLTIVEYPYNEPLNVIEGPSSVWAFDSQFGSTGDTTIFPVLTDIDTALNQAVDHLAFGAYDEVGVGGAYDGSQFIWLASVDVGTGDGLLRQFDPTGPSVSPPNVISLAGGVDAIAFGGGFVWAGDATDLIQINPASPAGPYTYMVPPAAFLTAGDVAYDGDGPHYFDVLPRVWVADTGGSRLVRVELMGLTIDGTVALPGASPNVVALGTSYVWSVAVVGALATLYRIDYDPPAISLSSTTIDAIIGAGGGGDVFDCIYHPGSDRVFVLGRDAAGDSVLIRVIPSTLVVDTSIVVAASTDPTSGGPPPRLSLVGGSIWVALSAPVAGGSIHRVDPVTMASTAISPNKTISWETPAGAFDTNRLLTGQVFS